MAQRKHKHMYNLSWREWTLVAIIAVTSLSIVTALVAKANDKPVEQAERKLSKIADDYYLTYLYPKLLGRLGNDPAEMLGQYSERGVAPIYLRQLLSYNDGEYQNAAGTFERIGCNTNSTGVHYIPVEPYGPYDYEVEYLWNCEQKN